MAHSANSLLANLEIVPLENTWFLRAMNGLLPLGHRLFPLVSRYAQTNGLISIPYGHHQLLFPSRWLTAFNADVIFVGAGNKPEWSLLMPLLNQIKSGVVVDVGANIGEYVLQLCDHSQAAIIAYEPSPFSFAVLSKAVALNGLQKVELRNRACGNAAGTISLDMGIVSYIRHDQSKNKGPDHNVSITDEAFDSVAGSMNQGFTPVSVQVVTLDDDLKDGPQVALLKVDVEGFEYHVLSGALKIIEKQRPLLFVELHPSQIEPHGHTLKDVCDLLRPYYRFDFWDIAYEKHSNKMSRLLGRYFPRQPYHFQNEDEMLASAYRSERPAHPYLIGYPLS